jgi:Tfp pilus assembly protein PilF
LRDREFEKALQLLEPAIKESPKNPQLRVFQGLAYSGKGDQKAARASYQKALTIAPDYLPALEGAADLEYDAGHFSAIPLLQHVLRLRPNDLTSHAMLAVLAYRKRDCATATQHFALSGSLVDSQPGALQEYGACLMEIASGKRLSGWEVDKAARDVLATAGYAKYLNNRVGHSIGSRFTATARISTISNLATSGNCSRILISRSSPGFTFRNLDFAAK